MKIAVCGLGYVELSNAAMLAKRNQVVAVDFSAVRAEQLDARRAPVVDAELENFLATHEFNLTATLDAQQALIGADTNKFDTPPVEAAIRAGTMANRMTAALEGVGDKVFTRYFRVGLASV